MGNRLRIGAYFLLLAGLGAGLYVILVGGGEVRKDLAPQVVEVPTPDAGNAARQPEGRPADGSPGAAPQPSGPGVLRGIVRAPGQGAPVGGVAITVEQDVRNRHFDPYPAAHVTWTATTGVDGKFEVAGLPALPDTQWQVGWFLVLAEHASGGTMHSVRITTRKPGAHVALTLGAAGGLGGYVVDPEGVPVADAIVVPEFGARIFTSNAPYLGGRLWYRTQADGAFHFPTLPAGEWRLMARAPGFAPSEAGPYPVGTLNGRIELSRGFSVAGQVRWADEGAPAAGVGVVLTRQQHSGASALAKSDANGRFEFPAMAPGRYQASVDCADCVLVGKAPGLYLEPSGSHGALMLVVGKGASVSGVIIDTITGEGVPDLEVQLSGESGSPHTTTQQDRHYQIANLQPGTYDVTPRGGVFTARDGLAPTRTVTVREGEALVGIDFAVAWSNRVALSGRVIDENGVPLEGVAVGGRCQEAPFEYAGSTSDQQGVFRLAGYPPDSMVRLEASGTGYATAYRNDLAVGRAGRTDLEITLQPGGRIAGVLVDEAGRAVAYTRLFTNTSYGNATSWGYSDGEGAFSIAGLSAGKHTLEVSDPSSSSLMKGVVLATVDLASGQEVTGLRCVLPRQGSLSGRITDTRGRPVEHAMVQAINLHGVGTIANTETGPDGHYTLLLSGRAVNIVAVHDDYSRTMEHLQVDGTAQSLDLVLQGLASIEGQVIDQRSGTPLEAFEVAIVGRHLNDPLSAGASFQPHFDPEGRFHFTGVAVGKATVVARAKGFEAVAHPIASIREHEELRGVVIPLVPGRQIHGVVRNTAGAPVAGAQIHLLPPDRLPYLVQYAPVATSDAAGEFTIDEAPTDQEFAVATHADHLPTSGWIGGDGALQFVLNAGAVLMGTVTLNGAPAPDVDVRYDLDDGNVPYNGTFPTTNMKTDGQGRYRFEGLASAEGRIRFRAMLGASTLSEERLFTTGDNQTTEIHVALRSGTGRLTGVVTRFGERVRMGHVSLEGADGARYGSRIEEDGSYGIEGIPAGHFEVSTEIESSVRRAPIEIAAGQSYALDFDFDAGVGLWVTVPGAGQFDMAVCHVYRGHHAIPSPSSALLESLEGDRAATGWFNNDDLFEAAQLHGGIYTVLVIAVQGQEADFVVEYVELGDTGFSSLELTLP